MVMWEFPHFTVDVLWSFATESKSTCRHECSLICSGVEFEWSLILGPRSMSCVINSMPMPLSQCQPSAIVLVSATSRQKITAEPEPDPQHKFPVLSLSAQYSLCCDYNFVYYFGLTSEQHAIAASQWSSANLLSAS